MQESTYLPRDLLAKVDEASRAAGIPADAWIAMAIGERLALEQFLRERKSSKCAGG